MAGSDGCGGGGGGNEVRREGEFLASAAAPQASIKKDGGCGRPLGPLAMGPAKRRRKRRGRWW